MDWEWDEKRESRGDEFHVLSIRARSSPLYMYST